ncbi:hypothetical protein AOQ84DRAFT_362499 [Glonium stellatum]|uniref:Uncharacterized protein n=1 Tax=Glonium stellatum TaxID=574774 RepID=A0A8E2F4A9_9PEZI|nr:hypothetical protein AOQ84DRAFT_362499 [Glonium stellatum]
MKWKRAAGPQSVLMKTSLYATAPEDNIPNHQPTGNLESSQNRTGDKDTASASREKKQSQLSDPMQKQMPCTPAQTPNKVSSYKKDDNTKGDTQKDMVWGGIQNMYLNYLRGSEGHSEAETGLHEPMKDCGEAKINSSQPADTVAVSKHISPVTLKNREAKTDSPEPMESHGEAKTDSPQPKEDHIKGLPVPPENSLANPTNFLRDIPPRAEVLPISDVTILNGQLKYLLSWLPTCCMTEDLKRLRNPGYRSI